MASCCAMRWSRAASSAVNASRRSRSAVSTTDEPASAALRAFVSAFLRPLVGDAEVIPLLGDHPGERDAREEPELDEDFAELPAGLPLHRQRFLELLFGDEPALDDDVAEPPVLPQIPLFSRYRRAESTAASLVRWDSVWIGMSRPAHCPSGRRCEMIGRRPPSCGDSYSCLLLALLLPATAQAGVRVSAFYYPWYGTSARGRRVPALGPATGTRRRRHRLAYYPARGLYSSSDTLVDRRSRWTRSGRRASTRSPSRGGGRAHRRTAGCPRSSRPRAPTGSRVAVHLEPYAGRTVASTVADLAYLAHLRRSARSTSTARSTCRSADWAAAKDGAARGRLDGLRADRARRRGGGRRASTVSTPTTSSPTAAGQFARLCDEAHAVQLLCAPSVGPGLRRAPRQRRPDA